MESAEECVTTHQSNQVAVKMGGAGGSGPYLATAGGPVLLIEAQPVDSVRLVAAPGVPGLGLLESGCLGT